MQTILDTVPIFPETRSININDFELYEKWRNENNINMADLCFANMFLWNDSRHIQFCKIDSALVPIGTYENTQKVFYPIGKFEIKSGINALLKFSPIITKIPKSEFESLKSLEFNINEDRDNFEYVYKCEDLATLHGRKFDGKRNNIRNFARNYKFEYQKISHGNCKECIEFLEKWINMRKREKEDYISEESIAIKKSLEYFDILGLMGGVIKVDEQIEAFTIAGKLNEKTAIIHSEKANPNIHGLYQVINQVFAQSELLDFEYINREQDLGISGLRKAKMSYHPDHFIRKFEISRT